MALLNVFLIFSIGFLGRILPHIDNNTPIFALCVLVGFYFPTRLMINSLLLSYLFSDILLAIHHGFPMFGSWTFYTYTGILALIFLGLKMPSKKSNISWMLLGTTGFWLWTNLGVYLHSGLYPKTTAGFSACYTAALPFLQKSLIGDLFWFFSLSLCFPLISRYCEKRKIECY